jgi:hypothetical protein
MYELRRPCLPGRVDAAHHRAALGEENRMRWRHAVVAGLALGSATASAADPTIEDFGGVWRGTELRISGDAQGLALEPADLDMQIQTDGDGFQISSTGLARKDGVLAPHKIDARFTATDRPGVYAFEPGGSSFFGLFADPATGNPLQGETLLWARLAGPTLTVYSLAITDDGDFDLHRYARTLAEGGMDVQYTRRVANNRVVTLEGRVKAEGG